MIKVMKPLLRTMDFRTVRPGGKTVDPDLKTSEHQLWREDVIRRAGYRCEWILPDGQRCGRYGQMDRMFADHIIERRDGGEPYDPENGQCLCGAHHSKKTAMERARRMRETF